MMRPVRDSILLVFAVAIAAMVPAFPVKAAPADTTYIPPPLLRRLALEEPSYFAIGAGTRKRGTANSIVSDPDNQARFRLALRVPVLLLSKAGDGIYFSFSQESLWNPFDGSAASLDNSYTPQFMGWLEQGRAKRGPEYRWWRPSVGVAYLHQSNGFIGDNSRSWNRALVMLAFGDPLVEQWTATLEGWAPFSVDHRNTDIAAYRGLGRVAVLWQPLRQRDGRGADRLGLRLVSDIAPEGRFISNLEATLTAGLDVLTGVDIPWAPTFLLQGFWGRGESFLHYRRERHELRVGIAMMR